MRYKAMKWGVVSAFSETASKWSEFAFPANQHPKGTIKKKKPQTFAHPVNLSKNLSISFP